MTVQPIDLADILAHRYTTPAPLTAADCGLTNDPIAHILELRATLQAAIEALTPAQRAELVQYGWPQAPGLKAVA